MSIFIEIGCEKQRNAHTKAYAASAYAKSCRICTERGYNINCDHCPIRAAFHEALDRLETNSREVTVCRNCIFWTEVVPGSGAYTCSNPYGLNITGDEDCGCFCSFAKSYRLEKNESVVPYRLAKNASDVMEETCKGGSQND